MIDQLQAVAIATRFLVTQIPEAAFREVWAARRDGKWWVSFGRVTPPNVVESPGGWCVTVDVTTGQSGWFEVL